MLIDFISVDIHKMLNQHLRKIQSWVLVLLQFYASSEW
jgi:hypothetical protein